MKKLIALLIVAVFFSYGCQENNPIEADSHEDGLSKSEPNWIQLPEPAEKSLLKNYRNGEWVNNNRGGKITVRSYYWAWFSKNKVELSASLEVPSDAWDESVYGKYEYITLSVHDNSATSTFGPHMNFTKPVIYNAKFSGLDLSGIDPGSINFVYQDPSGAVEQVDFDALNVDVENGALEIVNARIPHFSRYGFTW